MTSKLVSCSQLDYHILSDISIFREQRREIWHSDVLVQQQAKLTGRKSLHHTFFQAAVTRSNIVFRGILEKYGNYL